MSSERDQNEYECIPIIGQVSVRLRLDEALDEYGSWAERWREADDHNNRESAEAAEGEATPSELRSRLRRSLAAVKAREDARTLSKRAARCAHGPRTRSLPLSRILPRRLHCRSA